MSEKKKILLADDEEDIRTIVRALLESEGHTVILAYDGLAAIDLARSEQPDLILLDVMMPVADGYEVCTRLRAESETKHIPIIMLSAMAQTDAIDRGLSAGAKEYITKPFDPIRLGEVIDRVLSEA